MVKLLVFLGNPGKVYARTRHNVGWMVAEHRHPQARWSEKFHGLVSSDNSTKLLKPSTYMNESGRSVRACMDFYGYTIDEILVVHDDLELPFGTLRLQKGGGLGGHNGLKSIRAHIQSDQFFRLRIGIGRPQHGSVASFVLERFTPDEEISLPLVIDLAEKMLTDAYSSLPVTNTLV
ncbi:aminoacyl-tRNA hydrolase [Sphaerochaeta sp.]|jgi:PTH1 family peptidyl-tRNA hydrolase|uniref:aminoacyl-tRNA hydrolase n=1 Tax=Sphaerochaeta sp. TaxID=1972642 RepID=UPI00258C413A|nr:aminoacyl-tRNA hydrolase [Sphaerochaeta sp.]MDD3455413.1 aminoacyl-tRNA hydrolase [Sphaerochaeta sp.]MDD4037098.1 aminoacyl-tRNA hydrolase [Sphaerochaeta sp.]MDX9982797.1 aminoacyl-tRNA hydrolase [Sphaerochaeta sp.]